MAHGRFAAVELAASIDSLVWTVPNGVVATVNINVCNKTDVIVPVSVAVVDGPLTSLSDEDWIIFECPLAAKDVIEKFGVAVNEGQTIVARADIAGVNVAVNGYTQPANVGLPA